MIEKNPNSWQEFKAVIAEIRETYGYHKYSIGNNQTYKGKNTVLFRGQQCTDWPLQTTLERKTNKEYTVSRYLAQSARRAHELVSYTGSKWDIEDLSKLTKEIREKQDNLFGPYLPREDYLIYLRHHGYPSPLLDWSESPYISAYFAMNDAGKCDTPEQRVAIYAYIESINSGKDFWGGFPLIKVIYPSAGTHKRHFIQKAWYTVAVKWSKENDEFIFCSHDYLFNKHHSQDILIKITLPISERNSALKDLDDYNINHFTLFQTEDALVKWLGVKDFDYKDT